jgi:hypothetical protein
METCSYVGNSCGFALRSSASYCADCGVRVEAIPWSHGKSPLSLPLIKVDPNVKTTFGRDGFAIWYKRLEQGAFRPPSIPSVDGLIDRRQLTMLLEGIVPKKVSRRYVFRE